MTPESFPSKSRKGCRAFLYNGTKYLYGYFSLLHELKVVFAEQQVEGEVLVHIGHGFLAIVISLQKRLCLFCRFGEVFQGCQ
ncbi:MAG: hypothetical protein ACTTI2_06145 [Bacteroidales bacterium]